MATTLTVTSILADFLAAFTSKVPALDAFSMSYSTARAKKDQVVLGHIESIPATSAYDAGSGGYFNSATESRSLLVDVPVTLSNHRKVTVKVSHLNAISDEKRKVNLANMAFSLRKYMVDTALATVLATNFSRATTEAVADCDAVTLQTIRADLATYEADLENLFGIVGIPVMTKLKADNRLSGRDYYGQLGTSGSFGFENVEGFRTIFEYKGMPANGENLIGFFGDKRAIVGAAALPEDSEVLANELGIATPGTVEILQAGNGGPALMAVMEMEPGTRDLYISFTLLFGFAAGKQTGSAGTISDYAGHRLKSA